MFPGHLEEEGERERVKGVTERERERGVERGREREGDSGIAEGMGEVEGLPWRDRWCARQ